MADKIVMKDPPKGWYKYIPVTTTKVQNRQVVYKGQPNLTTVPLMISLGGSFERVGGVDEAVGGGNQKVGSSN